MPIKSTSKTEGEGEKKNPKDSTEQKNQNPEYRITEEGAEEEIRGDTDLIFFPFYFVLESSQLTML